MNMKKRLLYQFIKTNLRMWSKTPSRYPLPIGVLRSGMELGTRLMPLQPGTQVETLQLNGVSTECVSQATAGEVAILHFHGGGFMLGSPASHRGLASELAARTGAKVYVPDYRLAPEHACPAALDDCLAAWQGLLDMGFVPGNIVLSGDSAGGALALALAQTLRDANQALPAALVLMSPYLDSTLEADSIHTCRRRDPMLTRQLLKRGSDGYRGELPADDPRVSPLFGDQTGLPPILLQVGSEEILRDDAIRLTARCKSAGVAITHQVFPGMWHDFQLFSRFVDEAGVALDDIAAFVALQWEQTGARIGHDTV